MVVHSYSIPVMCILTVVFSFSWHEASVSNQFAERLFRQPRFDECSLGSMGIIIVRHI